MKNNIYRLIGIFLILTLLISSFIIFWFNYNPFPIAEYFPLNTNDKYIYEHYEGGEQGIVSITVKNVKQQLQGKSFNFFWQGKYNDRIQSLKLSPWGLALHSNRHLVGQAPLKVVRKLSPPLIMIPSRLNKFMRLASVQSIFGLDGKLIDKESIDANIYFFGPEDIKVKAGNFHCLHFYTTHIYKNNLENSLQMHTYNFWVAPGVGIVKFIHSFIPFIYVSHIPPQGKTIMNRYADPFVEIFDLREAFIKGKIIGGNY